jgi:hypothetical protein
MQHDYLMAREQHQGPRKPLPAEHVVPGEERSSAEDVNP